MKRALYLVVVISTFTSCVNILIPEDFQATETIVTKSADTNQEYYWHFNQKIYINQVPDKYIAIARVSENESASTFSNNQTINWKRYNISDDCLIGINKTYSDDIYLMAEVTSTNLATYEDIIYSAPFYSIGSGEYGLSNIFHVKLKSEDDKELIIKFAEENNAVIVGENIMPLWYTLICNENTPGNALELSNKAYESGMFAYSDVEFIDDISLDIEQYNDPEFKSIYR